MHKKKPLFFLNCTTTSLRLCFHISKALVQLPSSNFFREWNHQHHTHDKYCNLSTRNYVVNAMNGLTVLFSAPAAVSLHGNSSVLTEARKLLAPHHDTPTYFVNPVHECRRHIQQRFEISCSLHTLRLQSIMHVQLLFSGSSAIARTLQ